MTTTRSVYREEGRSIESQVDLGRSRAHGTDDKTAKINGQAAEELQNVQDDWIGRGLCIETAEPQAVRWRIETHQAELAMIPWGPHVVKSRTADSQLIRKVFLVGRKIKDSHSVRSNCKSKAVVIGNVD
jgi:hypothetical protein